MNRNPLTARRTTFVVVIYLLSVLWGAKSVFEMDPRIRLVFSLALSVFVTQFCIVDSQIRGKPLLRSFHWLIFFTWPISVPIYLIRSRGVKRLHWVVIAVVGYIAASWAGYAGMWFLVSGAAPG
jgi:hypothetical protein